MSVGLRYIARRFPLHTHGVGLLIAFAPAYALFGVAGGRFALQVRTALEFLSFVILFMLMRWVDDLEDLRGDAQRGRIAGGDESSIRRALLGGVACAALVAVGINVGHATLPVAAVGVVGILTLPLARRWMTPLALREALTTGSVYRNSLLAVLQEGLIFVLMLFIYTAWASDSGGSLGIRVVAPITAIVWVQYLFWKYARITPEAGQYPYGLGFKACRVVLLALLGVYFVSQCLVRDLCGFSRLHVAYAIGVTCAFGLWAAMDIRGHRVSREGRKAPAVGLLFVAATGLTTVCSLAQWLVSA